MHIASHRFTLAVLVTLLGGAAQAACGGADADPTTEEPIVAESPTLPTEGGTIREGGQPTETEEDAGMPSGDSGIKATGATCATNGAKVTSIEDNHTANPHKLADLPAADFKDPQGDKRYTLSAGGGSGGGGGGGGGQTHTHTLTLTAAQRAELAKGGKALTKNTSGQNGNVHAVTLACK